MTVYELSKSKLFRIEGPALVRVISGKIYAMGVEYSEGSKFTVLRARKVIVKAIEDSKLDLVLGPDGYVEEAKPEEEVIDKWEENISKLSLEGTTTVILGAMDVGKTTLTVMLANKASIKGFRVGIIDADLGQNDLGPPATVDASILEPFKTITHLRILNPVKSIFLKTTSVERVWKDVVKSTGKLVDYLRSIEKVNTVIVNTDGWVATDEAVRYKISLISKINPDNVIVIKRGEEVEKLISTLNESGYKPLILPAPPAARTRTRQDRKIHREMGYGKYLTPTREVSINLEKTPIINIPICTGIRLKSDLKNLLRKFIKSEILYSEQIEDKIVAICNIEEPQVIEISGGGLVIALPRGWEHGLLVGLEDEDNYLLALGMLRKIYYNSKKAIIAISRNFDQLNKVKHIRIGMIRLNKNFEEIEKVHYLSRIENIFTKGS